MREEILKSFEEYYEDNYPSISEEDVQKFEKIIGAALPPDYRNLLLKYNGARFVDGYMYFPVQWGDSEQAGQAEPWGAVDVLERLDLDNDELGLLSHLEYYKFSEEPYFPDDFISIGGADGGLILLGIKGDKYGKIYFCDYNSIDSGDLWHAVGYVAESFESFLDMLNPVCPDADEENEKQFRQGEQDILPESGQLSTGSDVKHELDAIESDLDAAFARRKKLWRIRAILTVIVVGVVYYFYPNLWWLWFIPGISLVAMGIMYRKTKKRIFKARTTFRKV